MKENVIKYHNSPPSGWGLHSVPLCLNDTWKHKDQRSTFQDCFKTTTDVGASESVQDDALLVHEELPLPVSALAAMNFKWI